MPAAKIPSAEAPPLSNSPRITLFEMEQSVQDALAARGYASRHGSFGARFLVKRSDSLYPIDFNPDVPLDLGEDEIVIADLQLKPAESERKRPDTPQGVDQWWQSMHEGVIDPRPLTMAAIRKDISRLVEHGGVLVVFVGTRYQETYTHGHLSGYDVDGTEEHHNTWAIHGNLASSTSIAVSADEGNVIEVDTSTPLGRLLKSHVEGARFKCVVERQYGIEPEHWLSLAKNKFGRCVAAAFTDDQGLVVLLPNLSNKAAFVAEFVADFLPEIKPELFPNSSVGSWIHQTPYEFSDVLALESDLEQREQHWQTTKLQLAENIANARTARKAQYALLTETGAPLVDAVESALKTVGFKEVVNADKEANDDAGDLGEDLQVLDSDPLLLVEVKGIGGMPSDDDILAAQKYLAPRMQQWNKTNLKALFVVNHQRHMPALARQTKVIRNDLEKTVIAFKLGVITTTELFKLVRNVQLLGWPPNTVLPIFAKNGLIEAIPTHYEYVGTVTRYMGDVCGITVEAAAVKNGDILAFQLAMEFEEQVAAGIQVDGKPVPLAAKGQVFGLKTGLPKERILNQRVFRRPSSDADGPK
jgi:hypothetical protein